jgi:hypothetical protein
MTPLETLHTGPVALSQEQSDLVWDVLEGNAAVVSLLRALGARPIPEGAQDRSWEAVKQIIPANRECASKTTGRLSSLSVGACLIGRPGHSHRPALPGQSHRHGTPTTGGTAWKHTR